MTLEHKAIVTIPSRSVHDARIVLELDPCIHLKDVGWFGWEWLAGHARYKLEVFEPFCGVEFVTVIVAVYAR